MFTNIHAWIVVAIMSNNSISTFGTLETCNLVQRSMAQSLCLGKELSTSWPLMWRKNDGVGVEIISRYSEEALLSHYIIHILCIYVHLILKYFTLADTISQVILFII